MKDKKLAKAEALLRQYQKQVNGIREALLVDRIATRITELGASKKKNSLEGRISPGLFKHSS